MPELPEVETVARQLHSAIAGRRLRAVEILDSKLAAADWPSLSGQRIRRVFRSGKQVALELGQAGRKAASAHLLVHLRMTGRLIWVPSAVKTVPMPRDAYGFKVPLSDKSLRACFSLEGGELRFYDPRRFGVMQLVGPELPSVPGLEPFSPAFSAVALAELLAGARGEVKPWLLRQDKLAGIGNIYASEILFAAGIHPQRSCATLSLAEIAALRRETLRILSLAIKHCGTTFSDFQDSTGSVGGFARYLKVYGREGQACQRCKAPLQRIVQQQRSTFYCSDCQA